MHIVSCNDVASFVQNEMQQLSEQLEGDMREKDREMEEMQRSVYTQTMSGVCGVCVWCVCVWCVCV